MKATWPALEPLSGPLDAVRGDVFDDDHLNP